MKPQPTGTHPVRSAASVKVDGVSKSYSVRAGDDVLALDRVDLDIAPGSFVAVVGPSGCGKSTLLSLLAGLIPLSSGRLTIDGQSVVKPHPKAGVVFQSDLLLDWRSILDNVLLPVEIKKLDRKAYVDRARDLLAQVGLQGFDDKFPTELSGGMRQRAAICRALIQEPGLLLMDEPFGALDHQTRELMQELLLGIWEAERKTVLFVTHDIDEAVFMGTRIVVMSARPGRIKLDRAVPLAHPRHYSVKTTPPFAELKAELTEAVRAEVLAAQRESAGAG